MTMEVVDTQRVNELIDLKGLKRTWVIGQMALTRTAGYAMIRDGVLPKDEDKRNFALKKLAQILDTDVRQILLRLEAKRRTA